MPLGQLPSVRFSSPCRDIRNAARVIGDTALFARAEQCSALIRRDVVFAPSLYLSS